MARGWILGSDDCRSRPAGHGLGWALLGGLGLLALLVGWPVRPASAAPQAALAPDPAWSPAASYTATLPLVWTPNPLRADKLIWLDDLPPGAPHVALFRRVFDLDGALEGAELSLLADTRYEVWLDGEWLGRGPARFGHRLAEYDVYDLGHLAAGSHTLAVLVQWAPNTRRSESLTPFLVGHLAGRRGGQSTIVLRSGPEWRVLAADAWRRDSAQVHVASLIGPTELVDLAALPADWMQPAFDDAAWPQAVVKSWLAAIPVAGTALDPDQAAAAIGSWSLAQTQFRSRTIPLPAEAEMPLSVLDAGTLSPGREMVELVPPLADPYRAALKLAVPASVTVETLGGAGTVPPFDLRLDGVALSWQPVGEARPDVIAAETRLTAGSHELSVAGLPADGATFGVSTAGIEATWPFAQGLHAGRRLLLAEPVSQPEAVVLTAGEGLTVEFGSPASYLVVDVGRVVHGRLVAQVSGPAGAVLDAGWSQSLTQAGRPLPYPGSLYPTWNQVDSWVLDGTARAISTIDARAGRYLLLAAWNRSGGDGPIRLENLRVLEERYPAVTRGTFTCDDPDLERIWRIGVETLYPNMVDAYTDTPWRERGQWWGDAFVSDRLNQVAVGDTALLARGLTFMALAFSAGRPDALAPSGDDSHMLDYGMLWVGSLRSHWQRTGDLAFLKSHYQALRALMGYLAGYAHAGTGLLDLPHGDWSQTVLIDWPAYDSRRGQSAAVNAMYYGALGDASAIAAAVGDTAQAAAWAAQAESVRDSVQAVLWMQSEGRYATTLFDGELVAPGVHAQAWPLAYGLVPPDKVERVATALWALLSPDAAAPNVDVYGMYWVLEALAAAGRTEQALALVRAYYGRLVDLGATTWWEGFGSDKRGDASLCHAWGGAPTWFLSTHVLGARQVAPARWLVRPALAGVGQAAGAIPLPLGDLVVSWYRPDCQDVTLHIVAPAGTAGTVVLALEPDATHLTRNGLTIWDHGLALAPGVSVVDGALHVAQEAGGSYTFVARQDCETLYAIERQ